jgi:hypothetical protein
MTQNTQCLSWRYNRVQLYVISFVVTYIVYYLFTSQFQIFRMAQQLQEGNRSEASYF